MTGGIRAGRHGIRLYAQTLLGSLYHCNIIILLNNACIILSIMFYAFVVLVKNTVKFDFEFYGVLVNLL